jgi:hypothetical protein
MRFSPTRLLAAGAIPALVSALPAPGNGQDKTYWLQSRGTNFTVYEHAATGTKLQYVSNSGICETTAGVNQYSGYSSVGKTRFQTRNPITMLMPVQHQTPICGSGSLKLETIRQPLLWQFG